MTSIHGCRAERHKRNRRRTRAQISRAAQGRTQSLTVFLFFRRDAAGKLFFYPVEIPPDHLDDNVRLNPGTVKVEDVQGNIVWSEPS